MKIVYLSASSGRLFHFGKDSLENTEYIFHSDSLFSAIINNITTYLGRPLKEDEEKSLLSSFPRISSAFPYVNTDSKKILFFPRPIGVLRGDYDYDIRKKLKKVRYVSLEFLKNPKIESDNQLKGKFLVSLNESKFLEGDIISDVIETKSKVPRKYKEDREGYLYQVKNFTLNYNGGFFFLVDGFVDNLVKIGINYIRIFGLGGERSYGRGSFENVCIEDFSSFNFRGKHYISLSLVCPKENEFNSVLYYNLLLRKGYAYSPFVLANKRKKPVIMFSEGSVFSEFVDGQIVNVMDNNLFGKHNVLRYGKSFLIKYEVIDDE